jgi:hypothetical protein
MPVALLVQAAVTILTRFQIIVSASVITLVHADIILDSDNGLLSDYPVLEDEVVTVHWPVSRGGRVPERVSEQLRSVQKAKPKPTGDREHHVPANGNDGRNGFVNGRNEGRSANGNDGRNGFVNGRNEGRHHNSSTNARQSYGQSVREISHFDRDDDDRDRDQPSMDSRSYDKIKQTFKCPKFTGQTKDWKQWNKGFQRYLSIWDLGHVLDPEFFAETPLSKSRMKDNKFVYYILEDATQGSALAASYVRQAPVENGFEAYYTLHDGFVFAGSTASTILINELYKL